MYTSNPSGQFYSLQYESSTCLRGWGGGEIKAIGCLTETTTCVVAKLLVAMIGTSEYITLQT